MLCMKRVCRVRQAPSTSQRPGTKSLFRPTDKPCVNRPLCSPIGLHMVSLVRASGGSFRTVVYDALGWGRVGCLLGEPIRRRPVLPGPAPPRRPAVRRPDPTCPWYVQALESTSRNGTGYRGPRFASGDLNAALFPTLEGGMP